MAQTAVKICRLCLTVIEGTNFEIVGDLRIEMIKTILVIIDLSITSDPIICCKCGDILQKCFVFKRACIDTEDRVKSFVTNISEPTKVNLADMYFKQLFKNDQICKRWKICRLCFNLNGACYADVNNVLENRSLQDLLKNCVPEANLDLTNDPLVCQLCVELLKTQFNFMLDCLEIEEKIKVYCNLRNCNNSNIVDLNNIRQYFEVIKTENCIETKLSHFPNTSHLKLEEVFIETEPDSGMLKYEELNMPENVEIKDEYNSENESSCREEEEVSLPQHEEMQSDDIVEQEHFKSVNVKSEKKLSCPKCSYTAKYKSAMKSHIILHKSPSEMEMFRCSFCDYETKRKDSLKQHLLIHKSPRELKMFKCASCPYEARRKIDIKDHMHVHNTRPYKCQYCSFESTNFKTLTMRHMLIHKGKQTFQCPECPYVTKDHRHFKCHSLVHKSISELTSFRCYLCPYQTKRKGSLKDHMIVHRDIPESDMFKCASCEFKCKRKSNLKDHILLHNNPSKVVYTCTECDYLTKTYRYLKRHKLIHKDISEVETFKCNECDFQSRYKESLKTHILQHNPAEVVYKCEKCKYSTKILKYFKKHGRQHKVESEMRFFKCNDCTFQSRWKESLRGHILTHIRKKMKNTNC